jgi:hypothetical protein
MDFFVSVVMKSCSSKILKHLSRNEATKRQLTKFGKNLNVKSMATKILAALSWIETVNS